MVTLIRAIVFLLLAFATNAFAGFPPSATYKAGVSVKGVIQSVTASSASSACSALAAATGFDLLACSNQNNPDALSGSVPLRDTSDMEVYTGSWQKVTGCPADATLANGECTCKSGTSESNGKCIDPEQNCRAMLGKTSVQNWTAGFQRTPSINSKEPLVGRNDATGKSVCDGTCRVAIDVNAPCPGCNSYVSQYANHQGLYRVSIEFAAVGTGQSCTPTEADNPIKPSAEADPNCPGYVGEVNGVKGCFGTADKPVTTSPNNVPSNRDQIPGNPPAGIQPPDLGRGSLATPTAGSGNSNGGPSSAATIGGSGSSGGTGNGSSSTGGSVTSQGNGSGRVGTQSGTEQQNCGAPGQPVCAVKFDEDGLPDGKEAYAAAQAQIDKNADDTKNAINAAGSMQQPTWSFSFQFPTGCTPFDTGIRGFVLNPCRYQSTIHDLMSMIWAAVTAFCIIGMVGRTIRES